MPLVRGDIPKSTGSASAADAARLLASERADERRSAARELIVDVDTGPAVARAIVRESDDRVLQALFTALIKSPTSTSVSVALDVLRSDEARLRTGAMDALRTMPAQVLPRMADLLQDTDTDVRILACELARSQPAGTIVDLLTPVLTQDSSGNVCGAAIEVLAEVAGPEQLELLRQCAARFPSDPFLAFSVETAALRIVARNRPL